MLNHEKPHIMLREGLILSSSCVCTASVGPSETKPFRSFNNHSVQRAMNHPDSWHSSPVSVGHNHRNNQTQHAVLLNAVRPNFNLLITSVGLQRASYSTFQLWAFQSAGIYNSDYAEEECYFWTLFTACLLESMAQPVNHQESSRKTSLWPPSANMTLHANLIALAVGECFLFQAYLWGFRSGGFVWARGDGQWLGGSWTGGRRFGGLCCVSVR